MWLYHLLLYFLPSLHRIMRFLQSTLVVSKGKCPTEGSHLFNFNGSRWSEVFLPVCQRNRMHLLGATLVRSGPLHALNMLLKLANRSDQGLTVGNCSLPQRCHSNWSLIRRRYSACGLALNGKQIIGFGSRPVHYSKSVCVSWCCERTPQRLLRLNLSVHDRLSCLAPF